MTAMIAFTILRNERSTPLLVAAEAVGAIYVGFAGQTFVDVARSSFAVRETLAQATQAWIQALGSPPDAVQVVFATLLHPVTGLPQAAYQSRVAGRSLAEIVDLVVGIDPMEPAVDIVVPVDTQILRLHQRSDPLPRGGLR